MKNILRQAHRWVIRYVVYGSAVVVPFLAYASWLRISVKSSQRLG